MDSKWRLPAKTASAESGIVDTKAVKRSAARQTGHGPVNMTGKSPRRVTSGRRQENAQVSILRTLR
jgi:hypothetical protein